MDRASHVHELLERATAILPVSDEDLISQGIAAGVSERIFALKTAQARLQQKYPLKGRVGTNNEL